MSAAKLVAAFALAGACVPNMAVPAAPKLEVTSDHWLRTGDNAMVVNAAPRDAVALVIEKLGARGFTLITTKQTATGVRLKLAGNRDADGYRTIGSVFYAWIDPAAQGSQIKLVGKPTIGHEESCPTVDDGETCTMIETYQTWGVSGREEAAAIRGVFAELALDDAGDTPPAEAGLTLRGCGGPMRWAAGTR